MPGEITKILLVEDEPMIVDMYKLKLEENGFEVLVTDKGSEALQLVKDKQPALVLLDVILPQVDGFSILQSIKAETTTKDIPVIILTNLSQESDQEKGQQLGAVSYLVKSQRTPTEVLTEIKKFIK